MTFSLSGRRLRVSTALLFLLVSPPLLAVDHNVCPRFENQVELPAGRDVPDVCYAGFKCVVGMRGHWLDITDKVTLSQVPSRPLTFLSGSRYPRASIGEKGADVRARESCVPASNHSREGFVVVEIEDITVSGWLRVSASRMGALGLGRDSDTVEVEFRDGRHFLHTLPNYGRSLTVTAGRPVDLQLTGRGLDKLRVKAGVRQPFPETQRPVANTRPPAGISGAAAAIRDAGSIRDLPAGARLVTLDPAPFEILTARFDTAQVRVNILRAGTVDLGEYFEFADADPAINRDFGWPQVLVRP